MSMWNLHISRTHTHTILPRLSGLRSAQLKLSGVHAAYLSLAAFTLELLESARRRYAAQVHHVELLTLDPSDGIR